MAKLRAAVIRDQLLDSLLDRQTDPDHATEPTDHKGQAYDTWIVAKLNHPASLFRCEACKTICCWKTIVRHPCAVNDLDYASYDALFAERNKTLCKPVGFKIERVTAPVEFPRLFEIMSAAVSLVTKDREWRYDTFKIPTTVEQTQGVAAKSWLFSCTLDTCKDLRCTEKTAFFRRNRTYRQNWHDMVS